MEWFVLTNEQAAYVNRIYSSGCGLQTLITKSGENVLNCDVLNNSEYAEAHAFLIDLPRITDPEFFKIYNNGIWYTLFL